MPFTFASFVFSISFNSLFALLPSYFYALPFSRFFCYALTTFPLHYLPPSPPYPFTPSPPGFDSIYTLLPSPLSPRFLHLYPHATPLFTASTLDASSIGVDGSPRFLRLYPHAASPPPSGPDAFPPLALTGLLASVRTLPCALLPMAARVSPFHFACVRVNGRARFNAVLASRRTSATKRSVVTQAAKCVATEPCAVMTTQNARKDEDTKDSDAR